MMRFFLSVIFFASATFGQSLLLKAHLDPQEVTLTGDLKLWAEVEAQKHSDRALREALLQNSTFFLEGRVSSSDFLQLLQSWGKAGFTRQERHILSDTIEKSSLPAPEKNRWLCRLNALRNCKRLKIFPEHLAPILQKYEFLVVDGLVYPKETWAQIEIPDESYSWIFLSSRFETYQFIGKWAALSLKNPPLEDWVGGHCSDYSVKSEVQAFDIQVLVDRRCLKPTVQKLENGPGFYERHKNKIWLAAGLALGAGALGTLSGQKIILEKPSFR